MSLEFADLCLLERVGFSIIEVPSTLRDEDMDSIRRFVVSEIETAGASSDYSKYPSEAAKSRRMTLDDERDVTDDISRQLFGDSALPNDLGDASR
jgi:hypothetical protein